MAVSALPELIPLISIHALLAESDGRHRGNDRRPVHFYPRSPCGERPPRVLREPTPGRFLSTLSLRRATYIIGHAVNLHPISIHALLAESDDVNNPVFAVTSISIHALLAESDYIKKKKIQPNKHFYPRSPCGERRTFVLIVGKQSRDFYPRSPCGERPAIDVFLAVWAVISIHALLAESDKKSKTEKRKLKTISIHALLAESDVTSEVSERVPLAISIHALLAESDQYFSKKGQAK